MPIEKTWVLKQQGDSGTVNQLAQSLGIAPVLANLLVQRGIETEQEAQKFFNPQLADLHDPFLMKDMDKAIKRISAAVRNNEPIMVYGDYDVDGTTAVALVYIFLRKLGHSNLMFYIPDRYTEGYGVSYRGIEYAERKGVKLVITLDCGIKAVDKVAYAKEKGIDFIICDHHLPGDEIPDAVAVLDSKQNDCNYPFKELSGCGVGFKLVQAYCQRHDMPFSTIEGLLDLVTVSIASDIVPLIGENRVLAYYGLQRLNSKPNKGLASIIKICGLENHTITIDDIVFKIGPRINAAGRMRVDEERKKLAEEQVEIDKTDMLAVHSFNARQNEVDRLDRKVHDLSLMREIAIQNIPQIMLIRDGDGVLIEKIQSSINSAIPLWESQMVIAIQLLRQKGALAIQRGVANTTNNLIAKNSELLKSGSLEVAKELERGIVDVEVLKKNSENLIKTLEGIRNIRAEGYQNRLKATQELGQIQSRLNEQLLLQSSY